MSHWTTIKTQVKSLPALAAACGQLGLPLIANAIARGYGHNTQKADYVIRLKGPYDIAVQRQADGTLAMTTDWWHGHVEKEVGAEFSTLLAEYNHAITAQAAQEQGLEYYRIGSVEDATHVNQTLGLYGEESIAYHGELMTVLV
jgi:hypothetical protein